MKSIFSELPNHIIIKILHENKINHQKDIYKERCDDMLDELDNVIHHMKNRYQNFFRLSKQQFIDEDNFRTKWCLAAIHNLKYYEDVSDTDDY